MKSLNYIMTLVFLFGGIEITLSAQEEQSFPDTYKPDVNVDDLGIVDDEFQELYFKALEQKSIEKYELALEALEKALVINSKQGYVYFELGKNHAMLENYDNAEKNYKKALELSPGRAEILENLFHLYYEKKDYNKAIPIVNELVKKDSKYKESKADLFFKTQAYDSALELLDEIDLENGKSPFRNGMRQQIYAASAKDVKKNWAKTIERLERNIIEDPKDEQSYLKLVYFYFEKGQREKAYEIAKKLEKESPDSKLVHIALYKFYLDEGNSDAAFESIMIVLKEDDIDVEFKYNMVKDLLVYVKKNPRMQTKLTELVDKFGNDEENEKIYMILAGYSFEKGKKTEDVAYYNAVSENISKDFELLKSKILVQMDFNKFSKVALLSQNGIERYPAQPILYLFNGIANNQLDNPKIALEALINGVDFIIEDIKMEADFYEQIAKSYQKLGMHTKANEYSKKAQQLQSKL